MLITCASKLYVSMLVYMMKLGKDSQRSPHECSSPNKIQYGAARMFINEADAGRIREHTTGKGKAKETVLLHMCLRTRLTP